MRLMKNDPKRKGMGKYALIRLDKLPNGFPSQMLAANGPEGIDMLLEAVANDNSLIEFGFRGLDAEFFVIKLKDLYAAAALRAYASRADSEGDEELFDDVNELAHKSANHPQRRKPD